MAEGCSRAGQEDLRVVVVKMGLVVRDLEAVESGRGGLLVKA